MNFQSYRVAIGAALLSIAYASPASAQPYRVENLAETFTPLVNPTRIYGTGRDDDTDAVNLPFPVTYFGQTFNQVSVCTNGFLRMGSFPYYDQYRNGSLASSPNNLIAPLWDDLATGNGHISHATTGTAPNRVFTVEWSEVTSRDDRSVLASFQVRFFEGGNPVVEIAYGWITNSAGLSATLGLRGPNANSVINFIDPAGVDYSCSPNCGSQLANLPDRVVRIGGLTADDREVSMAAGDLPDRLAPGSQGQVTVSVSNPTPTEVSVISGLYLSADASLDTSTTAAAPDLQLAITQPQAIPASGSLDITFDYTVPADPSAYTHIIAATDVTNLLDEISETNNAVARPIITTYDLHPTAVTGPDVVEPGQAQAYTVTYEDLGAPYSGPVSVRLLAARSGSAADVAAAVAMFDATATATPVAGQANQWTLSFQGTVAAGAIPAGRYQLRAVIDPDNTIPESNDTNNHAQPDRRFITGPDLRATGVRMTATQAAVSTNVEATVTFDADRGSHFEGAVPYRLYWSMNETLESTDPLGGDFTVTVPTGQTGPVTATAQLPPPAAAGIYRLIAVIDPENTIPEVNEGDNRAVGETTLRNAADFTVSEPTVTPTAVLQGTQITVAATVQNNGIPFVGNVQVQAYASTDRNFSADDVLVHSSFVFFSATTVTEVAYNQQFNFVPTDPAASPLNSGRYYLFLRVNSGGQPAEANAGDNVGVSDRFEVLAPDLALRTFSGPQIAFTGRPYAIKMVLTNDERIDADGFYVSIRRSDNPQIRLGDPEVDRIGPLTVPANGELEVNVNIDIPANTPLGDYYFGAILNITGDIPETDNTNNIGMMQPDDTTGQAVVHVLAPTPNFTAALLKAPSAIAAGEPFVVQRQITNNGSLDASAVPYAYYLSTDETIDASDLLIARFSLAQAPWEGPASVEDDRVLMAADVPAGTYFIGILVDPDNAVVELDEADNGHALRQIEVFPGAVHFVQSELPPALVGMHYEAGLFATGGDQAVVRWEVSDGALPDGLRLDATTGLVSGTPTVEGEFSFTAKALTNGNGSAEQAFSLRVDRHRAELKVATGSLPAARLNVAYSAQLLAAGGTAPYVWSSLGMPKGFSLSPEGVLSGTPDEAQPALVRVRVTDDEGHQARALLSLRVLSGDTRLVITAPRIPPAMVGVAFAASFAATPASDDLVWSLIDAPDGAKIDAKTGRFTVTPAAPGQLVCTVQVKNSAGASDRMSFILRVDASGTLNIIPPDPTDDSEDSAFKLKDGRYQLSFSASGGTAPYVWSLVAGAGNLPEGFALSADGVLTGSAATAGDYSFLVEVKDAKGLTSRTPYALRIGGPAAAPASEDSGCSCATAPRGGLPNALALLGLGFLLLSLGRGRALRAGLALAALLVARPATAQPVAGTPYTMLQQSITYISGATPTSCLTHSDDYEEDFNLPFSFRFYESDFDRVRLSVDGAIALLAPGASASVSYRNQPLGAKNNHSPANLIALMWDDLNDVDEHACFWMYTEGTAPNRVVNIEWANYSIYRANSARLNGRIRLHEGLAGQIDLEYGAQNGPFGDDFSFTAGIHDSQRERPLNPLTCNGNCPGSALPVNTRYTFTQEAEDLRPTGLQVPATGVAGERLQVPVSVTSMSGHAVDDVVVEVELRAGEAASSELLSVAPARATIATIDVHGTSTAVVDLLLPYVAAEQVVYPHLRVDTTDVFTETSEDNNAMVGAPITVTPSATDLTVWAIDVNTSAAIQAGDQVEVVVRAGNAGAPAASADLAVVLSKNPVISSQDTVLVHQAQAFAPGAVVTSTLTVQIPADLPTGAYYLGALVDGADTVQERSEFNNQRRSDAPMMVNGSGLGITTTRLPQAQVGRPYSAHLTALGPEAGRSWAVTGGALPAGLALTPAGVLQGTPTAVTTARFTVTLTSGAEQAEANLSLVVEDPATPLVILNTALQEAAVQQDYSQPLHAGGGSGPLSWTVTGLPKGLKVEPAAGGKLAKIAGQPTEVGPFDVQLTATRGSDTVSKTLKLTVNPDPTIHIKDPSLPAGTVGEDYLARLVATGGTAPYRWSAKNKALEAIGLKLNSDGRISGKPTKVGYFQVQARVEDSAAEASWDEVELFIIVHADGELSIETASVDPALKSRSYVTTIRAVGGTPPYTWSLANPDALPTGLTLNTSEVSGELEIQGTTEQVGLFALQVRAQDASGAVTERAIALRVQGSAAAAQSDDSGCACSGTPSAPGAPRALLLAGLFGLALLLRRRR